MNINLFSNIKRHTLAVRIVCTGMALFAVITMMCSDGYANSAMACGAPVADSAVMSELDCAADNVDMMHSRAEPYASAQTALSAAQTDTPELYSLSAAIIDGETGDLLYAKDGYVRRANASTTKILTCILALECGDVDDIAEVSSYAAKMPEVRMNVVSGERYRLVDLLYAMMLESYNDAAVVIADPSAGSVPEFAKMMNAKANEIGCTDTHFITPNGLDAEDDAGIHGTTASDLARIMRYCVLVSPKREEFLKITETRSYAFCDETGERSYTCTNHNALLDMMDGAISGKTGFTGDAGYCYVGAVERDGHTYIFSLLGCGWPNNKTYKWKDSRTLVAYAEENAVYHTVTADDVPDVTIHFSSKAAHSKLIKAACSLSLDAVDTGDIYRVEYHMAEYLTAPVSDGAVIGAVYVYRGDELVDASPVILSESEGDVTLTDEIINIFRCAF